MKKYQKDDCIFCKLANGEIPTNTIYEDDDFKVILDVNPATKGHCLILPKTHADNLMELPEEYCEKILPLAQKCGRVLIKTLHCDGLNILQNNGEVAGQTVFHLHVHLIPRYQDDTVVIRFNEPDSVASEALAQEIRKGFI